MPVTVTTENPGLEKPKESQIIDMAIKEMVDCLFHGYTADPADVVARCTAKVKLMGIE